MTDESGVFRDITSAVLDLQAAGPQNFQRPLKRLGQLLHHPDLSTAHQELTRSVDLDEFLEASSRNGGSMAGSQTLQWPDDTDRQLGLFLKLIDMLADEPNQAIDFGYQYFNSGNSIIAGIHTMTRDLIIPFIRDFKAYVLSKGPWDTRLVIPNSNKVFIVHGHDDAALQGLARFLERLGLEAIIRLCHRT